MLKTWIKYCAIGIPLSAFLHTCLQFAYAFVPNVDHKLWAFPIHFLLGTLVGGILILGPAYTIQAICAYIMSRISSHVIFQIIFGAVFQASVVVAWADRIGIDPSLPGNFVLTPPMIAAGFIAGGITSYFAAPK